MPGGQVIQIGPFVGGLNTYSDASAVLDNELVVAENVELDLDGSLVSRPPFVDPGVNFVLGATGNINILGYYYADDGTPYLIANDGLTSTYYYTGTSWTLITNTIAATALTQYNSLAYLMSPLSSGNPGGSWSPSTGFVGITGIPHGSVLIAHKSRLWAAAGQDAGVGQNGTRLYLSNVGDPNTWAGSFISIGAGDGQNVVQLTTYYNDLMVFKKNSIYRFSYGTDPTTGVPSKLSPDIGLAAADCVVTDNSIVYFIYNDKVYSITNYQINQINQKIPLRATTTAGIYKPYALSVFNRRLIVSYYDTMFVYSLRTQKWTTWKSQAFGPIGRIVQLQTNQTNQISAIAHSSLSAPATAIAATNLSTNPSVETNLTGWSAVPGTGGAATIAQLGPFGPGNNIPAGQYFARVTWTAAGTAGTPGIAITNIPVVPGTPFSAGMSVRSSQAAPSVKLAVSFLDSGNAQIGGTNVSSAFALTSGVWGAIKFEGLTVPALAATAALIAFVPTAAIGETFDGDGVIATATSTLPTYFDGSTPTDTSYSYAWTGAANNSTTTKTAYRKARTLSIIDAFSAGRAETMQCTVQTKNYNYEAPGQFKRMFYWGIDALFKGTVTGYANVVRLSSFPTWDQLLTRTWDQMLAFNWNSIGVIDASTVATIVNTGSVNSGRKFVKLGNGLRFRQIFFRLVFNTDGSPSTAPVRLFGIMTKVNTKETVVDQVT